jgi:FixJ family two-component response regulator
VILTGEGDDVALARAIQAGARGVVEKTAPLADVADAIRMAHRGEPLHRPDDVNRALRAARARSDADKDLQRRVDRLTPRELESPAIDGVRGRRSRDRGGPRHEPPHGAHAHVQNILTKLGVHSKTDAVVAAIRMGKVTPPDLASPDAGTPGAGPSGPAPGEPA